MHDKDTLKSMPLTINGLTRTYNSYFKNIRFYTDGDDFIYYGRIKEIKSYGDNYCLKFEEKPHVNEKHLQASIYIEKELVENYRKSRLFREQIDNIASKKRVKFTVSSLEPHHSLRM